MNKILIDISYNQIMEPDSNKQQYINILNNSNDLCNIIYILNYNRDKYDDIIDMAKQVIEPERDMPRVYSRPYVVGEGKGLPYLLWMTLR